ncbi:Serine-threonine/tyrosine-protein kinase, catalytic domain [Sesbania bispinosa]|nr:Serine-threonine/tyrosine-protein kinase, catalytic domain [Sesbania bispinosa]
MEQSRFNKQLQCDNMDPRSEEFQPGSQSVMQNYLDGMHTNRRPSDHYTSDVKPVLNYSIQTGEEFALEFMRDRVNLRKPAFSNVSDSNYTTSYMELKGVLGISHAGSESGSGISMLSTVDKAPTEFNRQSTSLHGDRSNYGSIRSIPRTSLNQETSQFVRGYGSSVGSDSTSMTMKCLCSFGGRILPRPSDGKLSSIGDDSEVQYVVAVNGMDLGSRNNSTPLGVSFSADDLHGLDRQTMDRETSRVAVESIGVNNAPLTNGFDSSSAVQSSKPILPTSSNAYEPDQLSYGDQMIQVGETSHQYLVHHGLNPAPNPVVGETPISMAPHLLNNQQRILNQDHPPSGLRMQNSELPTMQEKKIVDGSVKQENDPGKVLSSETPSPAPSQPFDGYLKNNYHEASVVVTMPEGHLPSLPSTKKVQHQDYEDASSTTSSLFVPAYMDSQSNDIDLSCLHPPPLPKRVYYSERTPREQVEVLNRSSKSDDTHRSQFHVSDLLSDVKPEDPVTETGDNLHDGNLLNPTENLSIAAKPLSADDHTNDNGFAKHQMNNLLPDANGQIKSHLSEHTGPELKQLLLSDDASKDVETEHSCKDNHIRPLLDETKTKDDNSDLPAMHHVSSVKHLDDPASNLPEIDWGEASGKEYNDNHMMQELPVSLAGNITKDVSQDFPPNVVSKQAEGDILIDIDDRFPRELLSDMFSKAILAEDPSSQYALSPNGIGLSINMENHEPKRWSYFQKLAQEGLDNVSLIDQDHLGFPPMIGKTGDNRDHHAMPLTTDGVPLDHEDSHLNFGEENQEDLHRRIGIETTVLKSNYDQSQLTDTESMQFDAMMENLRAHESEYEDGKFEKKNCNLPPLDPSLGDFDISTVQVIKNEDLEELRELGSGTFGTVYHGKWRGTDVAIKRIKKSCFTGRSSEQERLTVEFWREADILSKLHHPNVVAFYGVVQDGPGGTMATVTEFMVDGSLRHVLLRKDRYLDRRKRLIIAMDAAFGMEYLHSKNIVHFDLKCDNLLVNLKDPLRPICKVGDFGLSKIKRNTLVTGGVRGTLPWMAPELLNGSSNKVSEKVDVFSFGIVLWEILTGEEPYANMHYGAIIGGIVNNTLRPTIPSHCDPEWKTLMEQCWAPNPGARPAFTEIASRLRIMSAAASQTKTQGQKASK